MQAFEALEQIKKICLEIDTKQPIHMNDFMLQIEKTITQHFIENSGYSITQAASKMGLVRNTLSMRLLKLRLDNLHREGKKLYSKKNERGLTR